MSPSGRIALSGRVANFAVSGERTISDPVSATENGFPYFGGPAPKTIRSALNDVPASVASLNDGPR